MKKENEIMEDINSIREQNAKSIFELLEGYEEDVNEYLLQMVASVCSVSLDDLKSNKSPKLHITQARWLYWYSYRYMTAETYPKIAERFENKYGTKFHGTTVCVGCNKMMNLISTDSMWRKRWVLMKRILNAYKSTSNAVIPNLDVESTVRVVVYKPSNVNVKVEFKDIEE